MQHEDKPQEPADGTLLKTRLVGVFLLLLPLTGCLGWGDLFQEKRFIAGDYFLMESDRNTTDDLYLFTGDNTVSIAGPLNRIGWNQQYIIFTDANHPAQWNVITVKEHRESKITDTQRTQDSRFQHIILGSASEAWQRAKAQHST
jgi:hypothetical protein